jgi:uncharacterized protein (TIGR03435 family)
MLIREAYGIDSTQIAGAPDWLNSEKFDIEAKLDSSATDELHKLGYDQFMLESQRILQGLLADRFKLALHRETKELPVYALVFARGGPKLQDANPDDTYPNGIKDMNGKGHGNVIRMGRGQIIGQGIPISNLVRMLAQQLGRIVVDKTGLTGKYDFSLQWSPDTGQGPMGHSVTDNTPPPDSDLSLFTAIQEQLGLKLESQKGSVEILVIDHVEEPSEN